MDTGSNCRHEFVRIFQRQLKGRQHRLVMIKAYLPIGFKQTDFSYLKEGSYCFCAKCRFRLVPKRTNAQKAQARLEAQLNKQSSIIEEDQSFLDEKLEAEEVQPPEGVAVAVEELEVQPAELDNIDKKTVPVDDDDDDDDDDEP